MKSNGINNLHFTSAQGEPLLSPDFAECIALAIEGGFNVRLNTNCTPLGERNIATICDAAASGRLHIYPSFSGYDKESHETVYVGSNFENSAKKLMVLNQELRKRGLEDALTVNGIIMDPKLRDRHLAYLQDHLGIARSRVVLGLPDNFAGIVQVGSKQRVNGIYSFKQDLPYRSLRLCNLLAHYLIVYDDGKISACGCRDSEGVMEIGNITRESLMEIRNGPRFKYMIDAFMARNLDQMPLCRTCDVPYGDRGNPIVHSGPAAVGPSTAEIEIIDHTEAAMATPDDQSQRLRHKAVQTWRLNYTRYSKIFSTISLPPEKAHVGEGHAVFGHDFRPRRSGARLHIRLELNGWTAEDNSLVIAFYRDGGAVPAGLLAKPLPMGRTTIVDATFIVTANTAEIIPITFRVGPGNPGMIYINGDASGPKPVKPIPSIRIEEEMANEMAAL
jgi:hypothetical protein